MGTPTGIDEHCIVYARRAASPLCVADTYAHRLQVAADVSVLTYLF